MSIVRLLKEAVSWDSMRKPDWLPKVKRLEQVGVLRVLLFLREGEKMAGEFEEIMSFATFVKARDVLLDLGYVEVAEGLKRARIHRLTKTGREAAELIAKMAL